MSSNILKILEEIDMHRAAFDRAIEVGDGDQADAEMKHIVDLARQIDSRPQYRRRAINGDV